MKTTNYYNTLIEVAEDCPISKAEVPPLKAGEKTIAGLQFDLISKHPYKFTSDDVIFQVYATKNEIDEKELQKARELFFSKGQPCLRSSPLSKRYGWGVHFDEEGKIAVYAIDSEEYETLKKNPNLKVVKAMRSKRG